MDLFIFFGLIFILKIKTFFLSNDPKIGIETDVR
jgi:hypothetical protein